MNFFPCLCPIWCSCGYQAIKQALLDSPGPCQGFAGAYCLFASPVLESPGSSAAQRPRPAGKVGTPKPRGFAGAVPGPGPGPRWIRAGASVAEGSAGINTAIHSRAECQHPGSSQPCAPRGRFVPWFGPHSGRRRPPTAAAHKWPPADCPAGPGYGRARHR